MTRIVLDSGGTEVNAGSGAGDPAADTLRAATLKEKAWAADINTMTDELYTAAVGQYNPNSILTPLNIYDPLRWHRWFDDFVTGPSMTTSEVKAAWTHVPNFGEWTTIAARNSGGVIERNVNAGGSSSGGSWLQVAHAGNAGDYIHLTTPDAAGPVPGATSIPPTSATKMYAVAMRFAVSPDPTRISVCGIAEPGVDANVTLVSGTNVPGIYVRIVNDVATVHINNHDLLDAKTGTLPTTVTIVAGRAYEFELLWTGLGTFIGQYRYSTESPNYVSPWTSLGSLDVSTWPFTSNHLTGGPWMAAYCSGAIGGEIGVDYLMFAAER